MVVPDATAMAIVASEVGRRRREKRRAEGRSRLECMVMVCLHGEASYDQLMLSSASHTFILVLRRRNSTIIICGLRGYTSEMLLMLLNKSTA